MIELLPQWKESYKILSNIPLKTDEFIQSLANLSVIHDRFEVSLLALLSLAFNEKWIDTINLPTSPLHEKVRNIALQIQKAKKIQQLKQVL